MAFHTHTEWTTRKKIQKEEAAKGSFSPTYTAHTESKPKADFRGLKLNIVSRLILLLLLLSLSDSLMQQYTKWERHITFQISNQTNCFIFRLRSCYECKHIEIYPSHNTYTAQIHSICKLEKSKKNTNIDHFGRLHGWTEWRERRVPKQKCDNGRIAAIST